MDPISFMTIVIMLTPFLQKAGEKVTEKTVETLFDSRQDLAEKFKNLFRTEILSIKYDDSTSLMDINKQLEENPRIKAEVDKKITDNQELMEELIRAYKLMQKAGDSSTTINSNKIAQVNINPQSVSQKIKKF